MVNSTLQRTVAALSREERVELRDFINITLGASTPVLTEEQKAAIRRRAEEMDADPTLGSNWDDVYDELMADLR
ncbi:MAG: addiction module protein [Propionibacteriaceae bacterium]|nr:addiction module protein [Propionibacteriaceae bacterium]